MIHSIHLFHIPCSRLDPDEFFFPSLSKTKTLWFIKEKEAKQGLRTQKIALTCSSAETGRFCYIRG